MKNNTNNQDKRVVPSVHSGCSLAETGWSEYDDYDNPLKSFKIIPEGTESNWLVDEVNEYDGFDGKSVEIVHVLKPEIIDPSYVRDEALITITVPEGVHPITFLKENVSNLDQAWVLLSKNVVETLRELPNRYHQKTVAYGEFFRFENFDTVSLQEIEYFDDWKVLLNWEFDKEKFERNDTPDFIIQLKMKE